MSDEYREPGLTITGLPDDPEDRKDTIERIQRST